MKLFLLVGDCQFSKTLLMENSGISKLKKVTTEKKEFLWSNEEHFVTMNQFNELIEKDECISLIINEGGEKTTLLKKDLKGTLIMEASVYFAFLLKSVIKEGLITISFSSDASGYKTDYVINDDDYEATLKNLIRIINKEEK